MKNKLMLIIAEMKEDLSKAKGKMIKSDFKSKEYSWYKDTAFSFERHIKKLELLLNEHPEVITKDTATCANTLLAYLPHVNVLKTAAIALLKQPKDRVYIGEFPALWNESICEKMAAKGYKERLVIAGALIAAEIDRLNFIDELNSTTNQLKQKQ